MLQINYQKICEKVLSVLPEKQKEIIERRFGLRNGEKETLQKIGDGFDITRERVRQIEREGFSKLGSQKNEDYLSRVFEKLSQEIREAGGVSREDILLQGLGGENFQNHIYFLLTLGDPFCRFPETDNMFAFWSLEQGLAQKVGEIISTLLKKLARAKKPLLMSQLLASPEEEPEPLFLSSLLITKEIERGPLGDFGLTSWPEIKPRGVRDAAFLALKKAAEPLHFREIASLAASLPGDFFRERQVLPQTVHNELIRDERFVLVGRGMYALKDWGYAEGTVKDVIAGVLREQKKPLSKEEILEKVQEQRIIKANTVFLNLSNKNYFLKDENGNYTIVR